jgi:hypothetical protein
VTSIYSPFLPAQTPISRLCWHHPRSFLQHKRSHNPRTHRQRHTESALLHRPTIPTAKSHGEAGSNYVSEKSRPNGQNGGGHMKRRGRVYRNRDICLEGPCHPGRFQWESDDFSRERCKAFKWMMASFLDVVCLSCWCVT